MGNQWAWQNRQWESIQQFKETQRVWAIWGLVLFLVGIVLAMVAMLLSIIARQGMTTG